MAQQFCRYNRSLPPSESAGLTCRRLHNLSSLQDQRSQTGPCRRSDSQLTQLRRCLSNRNRSVFLVHEEGPVSSGGGDIGLSIMGRKSLQMLMG